MKIKIPSHLSDDALITEVKSLAGRGRETTAQLVAHLAELDHRRLYLRAGFPSLFMYCREVLRLSEAEAYNRIEAARAARRFPVLLDMLVEGTLNLTTVRLLAAHLTEVNHRELLASAAGKSRREVEVLVARHHPGPDVAPSVRKLPAPKAMPAPLTAPAFDPGEIALSIGCGTTVAAPEPPGRQPACSRPVSDPIHGQRQHLREAAAGPGAAPACRPDRRYGRDHRSGADAAA